jgi:16S rRNA (adenine1518-N6/adenine1519-N6)-dimethyltransferase
VAANLPYAVTGPMLAGLITDLDPVPERMALLVQLEVGDRLRAAPGSSEWGGLSALVQSCYSVARERRVGREVFRPRPNVDSALIVLQRRKDSWLAGLPGERRRLFAAFVRALFSGRRRKVRHTLAAARAAAGLPDGPPAPGVLGEMRPSAMSPGDFQDLWEAAHPET